MNEISLEASRAGAYRKPLLVRFGTIEELTRAGCFGPNDNVSFPGAGNTPGSQPDFYDICVS